MSGIVGKNLGRGSGIVTAAPVGADTVSGASIVDDAIDSEHYADGSIDNAHIADDAIDSEHYADGSIDNAHIADNEITLAKWKHETVQGAVVYTGAAGTPTYLAPGTSGQVLQSGGASANIAWAAESVTLANSVTLTNKTLTAPAVTLLTGTFNSPTGTIGAHTLGGAVTGGDQSVSAINLLDSGYITVAHGDTSGANIALDMNAGQHHSATISTDAVAISVTNAVGADEFQCGVLHLTNGGSQSVTFTAGDFAGGTAPTLTSSGLDVLAFWTYDGGTIIHWQVISTDSKSP